MKVRGTPLTVAYGLTGGTVLCVLSVEHLARSEGGPCAPFRPVERSKPTWLTLRAVEGGTWASTVVVRSGWWQTCWCRELTTQARDRPPVGQEPFRGLSASKYTCVRAGLGRAG